MDAQEASGVGGEQEVAVVVCGDERDEWAIALGGFDRGDPGAAAVGEAVFIGHGAFAKAVEGDGGDGVVGGCGEQRCDLVTVSQADPPDAAGVSCGGFGVVLCKTDRQARGGPEEDVLFCCDERGAGEGVAFIEADRVDAFGGDRIVCIGAGFFDDAGARGEEDVLSCCEGGRQQRGGDLFCFQRHEIGQRSGVLVLRDRGEISHREAESTAIVREDQHGGIVFCGACRDESVALIQRKALGASSCALLCGYRVCLEGSELACVCQEYDLHAQLAPFVFVPWLGFRVMVFVCAVSHSGEELFKRKKRSIVRTVCAAM